MDTTHTQVKTIDVQPGQRVRVGSYIYTVMGHESDAWLLSRDLRICTTCSGLMPTDDNCPHCGFA